MKKILVILTTLAAVFLAMPHADAKVYWTGRYNTANHSTRINKHVKLFYHYKYRSGTTRPKGHGRAVVQVTSVVYSYFDNRTSDQCDTFEGENYFHIRSTFYAGNGLMWRPGARRLVCENDGQNSIIVSYRLTDSPPLRYGPGNTTVPYVTTYWAMHNYGCCDENGITHPTYLWWLGIHMPLTRHK